MDQYNLLYDLGHGSRTKRSCETKLLTLIEDLMRNSLAGSQTDPVLLNFDMVNYQKLLLKLHHYGIKGPSLKFKQAFLSGRTQTLFSKMKKDISDNLSFNHIQKICKSASRSLGSIKRNKRTKSLPIRGIPYKTLVHPLVEYFSSVWSPYTDKVFVKSKLSNIAQQGERLTTPHRQVLQKS